MFSPENFFAECDETTPATAVNSIGNIYSLIQKYHFAMVTHILKPTNTPLYQKLRPIVAVSQKIEPPRGVTRPPQILPALQGTRTNPAHASCAVLRSICARA